MKLGIEDASKMSGILGAVTARRKEETIVKLMNLRAGMAMVRNVRYQPYIEGKLFPFDEKIIQQTAPNQRK